MVKLNNILIAIWNKIKEVKDLITTNISLFQTNITNEATTRANADGNLQTQITALEQTISSINTDIDLSAFETYMAENPINI